ncbi:unnamed protein product [Lampetra planeri]
MAAFRLSPAFLRAAEGRQGVTALFALAKAAFPRMDEEGVDAMVAEKILLLADDLNFVILAQDDADMGSLLRAVLRDGGLAGDRLGMHRATKSSPSLLEYSSCTTTVASGATWLRDAGLLDSMEQELGLRTALFKSLHNILR